MHEFEDPSHWDTAAEQYEKTAHPFTARFAHAALARVQLEPGSRVLDVAAGTGALALAAARTGAQVLATDFSPGMVARVAAAGLPNLEARVMDGQALDLPDASFDAVFSIFGVIMFPNWRKGMTEMARVTRPGGQGIVATWQEQGAATFLLLSQVRRKLFPDRVGSGMPEGVKALSDRSDFAFELEAAGFCNPQIELVTYDFEMDVAALANPDTLFGMSPDWACLNGVEQRAIVTEIQQMAKGRSILPIASTALIAVADRPHLAAYPLGSFN